jgi:PiT family inorganic phosphate transporter
MLDIWMLYAVVILALIFDYVNGFHDTANAIATCVSTRAISPSHAVWMAAVMNFLGAMYSTGVAKTIGGDIVKSADMVSQPMIVAALLGAILWNLGSWGLCWLAGVGMY